MATRPTLPPLAVDQLCDTWARIIGERNPTFVNVQVSVAKALK